MLKHTIRWALPLVVIAVVALCLVLSPVLATHAAPVIHHAVLHHVAASQGARTKGIPPKWYWRP